MNFESTKELIQNEYYHLCKKLDLNPLPLDIYIVNLKSTENTQLGTSYNNATPLYTRKLLVLPVFRGDLEVLYDQTHTFPPMTWDKIHPVEWPIWRIELWHEICHQVEDQLIGEWKSGNSHGKSWQKAIEKMEKSFNIGSKELENLL